MAGWDDTPSGANEGFEPEFNGFSEENISKHATGGGGIGDGGADNGCRVCGSDSHFARDCPDKVPNSGKCYNCGEMGHSKADCPNPAVERAFTGDCRICGEPGHRGADCPSKPPDLCKVCKQEGHMAAECSANRLFANFGKLSVQDLSVEEAWKMLEVADAAKDVDDIKEGIIAYAKTFPDVTFQDLEKAFRDAEMNTFLIAKQQGISITHTIVDLQGKIDQKFVIAIQFSSKPRRAKFAEGWPESPEANFTQLATAGWPIDRMVPKCSNCNELGHGSKQCTEEKHERDLIAITCANCNNEGHRARDCTEPRKSGKGKGCRNCGQEGHISKECPEPPNLDNVECKNCSQMGHFSRDCPDREPEICRNCNQEGHRAKDCTNERVMICRNCDEEGHSSRECPKPRDYTRVECRRCHEKGHTEVRCKMPAPEVEEDGEGGDGFGGGSGGGGGGGGGDEGDSWGGGGQAASGGW